MSKKTTNILILYSLFYFFDIYYSSVFLSIYFLFKYVNTQIYIANAAIIIILFIEALVIAIIAIYKSSEKTIVEIDSNITFAIPSFLNLIAKYTKTIIVAIIV